jgi:peptide/nickel transport system permease protein
VEEKLVKMAAMLDDAHAMSAAAALQAYREVAAAGWLEADPDRRKAVQERLGGVLVRIAGEFDPEKVKLEPSVYLPVLESLGILDAFLMSLTAALLLVVPALLRLPAVRRIVPRARRVRLCAIVVLVLVALPTAWFAGRSRVFETLPYKAALNDGAIIPEGRRTEPDGTVTAQGAVLFTPIHHGMNEQDTGKMFRRPSREHWLGTDELGRDLLTRMLWASRISLSVGFVATGIAVVVGIGLGAVAGFFRGWVDIAITRVIEVVLCFPSFFIVLAVIAVLPPSIYNVMVVLGLFGWTGIARLTRAEFFRLVDQDFVTAGRALGAGPFRLIFRHVLPNSLGPVLVAASFSVASAILSESSLSFLGFGVVPPDTSWGAILSTARDNPKYYWLVLTPGFAIFLTVTLYNVLGEGIRDAIDPRMRI